jgi:hypothetical protein
MRIIDLNPNVGRLIAQNCDVVAARRIRARPD